MDYYLLGMIVLLVAMVVIGGFTILAWRRRKSPTGRAFFFMMICAFIWVGGATLEMLPASIEERILLANLQFLGIAFLPLAELYLVLAYTGKPPSRRLLLILAVLPTLTNLVIWTDPLHHWFRGQPYFSLADAPFPVLVYDYHFWFYFVHAPMGYLFLLASIILALRAIVKMAGIYRRQMILFFGALMIPILTDLSYVAGYSPIPYFNLTPATFSIAGIIIFWNLFGFRFLDLLPLARDFVFDNLEQGIIILDNHRRIVDFNQAARLLTGLTLKATGGSLPETGGALLENLAEMLRLDVPARDVAVEQSQKKIYEITITPLSRSSQEIGQLINIRDISERTELYNQIRELAIRDDLTGAFSRRYFQELLKRSLGFIERHPAYHICILLLDIDHFKNINDTLGHEGGDQAIIALTRKCQAQIRPMDALGRWGGDEFAILMEDVTFAESVQIAGRIRQSVAELQIPGHAGNLQITISIGLAVSSDLPAGELNSQSLFRLADRALYHAKACGRNQVATSRDLGGER